ncbi:hypothetical protein D9613_011786 [Agrocybe pediades]|uniref:Uncharacterized protein n=1 Tax=Agrocybe pediades TaxID=84607 RepID=A0A8H4VJ12_9AGAR|nr:hypothetical protein D9613_011786 [Agrocybe pediades]
MSSGPVTNRAEPGHALYGKFNQTNTLALTTTTTTASLALTSTALVHTTTTAALVHKTAAAFALTATALPYTTAAAAFAYTTITTSLACTTTSLAHTTTTTTTHSPSPTHAADPLTRLSAATANPISPDDNDEHRHVHRGPRAASPVDEKAKARPGGGRGGRQVDDDTKGWVATRRHRAVEDEVERVDAEGERWARWASSGRGRRMVGAEVEQWAEGGGETGG